MTVRNRLLCSMAAVALVAFAAGVAGIGVRATHGGQASVDEPQYLLTALSLAEDGDLDISDELAGRRWRAFSDVPLPVQTQRLAGGRQVSPHDPLLPALLAGPMAVGGLVAAKATLSLVAALAAALTVWVAVRRFAVPVGLAVVGVGIAFASPPLAVYAQQVYPEMPAALATVAGVAALSGRLRRGGLVVLTLAVVALPWLGVKYAPVAAVLAALGLAKLWRGRHRHEAALVAAAWAAAGLAYLGAHRLLYGGWTVYATGDHFAATGELSVVGAEPDYVGRSLRLVGLLVDRGFGLAAWQPALLLLVPAAAALLRRRLPGTPALLMPLAAGWFVATFVALTMHGYWWPGRQVVVVAPLAVLAVLVWLARVPVHRVLPVVGSALGLAGVATFLALLVDGWGGELTWVVGFEGVDDPLYAARSVLLPDYRGAGVGLWVRHGAWVAVLLALAVYGWRTGRAAAVRRTTQPTTKEATTTPRLEKETV